MLTLDLFPTMMVIALLYYRQGGAYPANGKQQQNKVKMDFRNYNRLAAWGVRPQTQFGLTCHAAAPEPES